MADNVRKWAKDKADLQVRRYFLASRFCKLEAWQLCLETHVIDSLFFPGVGNNYGLRDWLKRKKQKKQNKTWVQLISLGQHSLQKKILKTDFKNFNPFGGRF